MYNKKNNYHCVSLTTLFFIYFFYSPFLSANQFNYTFESFTTSQGLTQNTINDIIQDQQGFIWLATFNGLNRYDGVRITQFVRDSPNTPIFDNEIIDLELADNGRMWILSRQFIFYKDQNQPFIKFIDLKKLYLKEEIRTHSKIISRPDKIILFHNQGVVELSLSGDVIKRYPYEGKERHAWLIMKSAPHNNDQLLATPNGLWVLKENSEWYQNERWPSFLKFGFQHTLVKTPEGYIIFGLESMHFLDKELNLISQRTYSFSGLDTFPFRASLTSDGTLWMTTFDKIFQINMEGNYLDASSLPLATVAHETGGSVTCFFIDEADGVWVGTSNIGAKYLNKNSQYFKTLYRPPINNSQIFSVTAMAEDDQNNLFIGTSGGEIYTKSPQQRMQKLSITQNNIPVKIGRTSGIIAKNNNLWIGSFTSLFHYDLKSKAITRLRINSEQFMTNINSIEWINDKIWGVSIFHGPFILDPMTQKITLLAQNKNWKKQWTRFQFNDLEKLGEHIFMVTDQGNILKVNEDMSKFELLDALSSQKQVLYRIVSDHNNKLWLLSNDTLYEFNPITQVITPRLKAFDYEQTAFYSILPEKNDLWIGASTDLIYYQTTENNVIKFSTRDGAINDEYNAISLKGDTKNLLFSTVNGILNVNLDDPLPHVNIDPQTKISQIIKSKIDKKSFEQSITQLATSKTDFILKSGESLLWQFSPSQVSYADQLKLEYRIGQNAWHPIHNWTLQLTQEYLRSGEKELEIRSAQKFSDDWHTSHQFNLQVYSSLQIAPIYYWLITLMLFVLFLIYLMRSRQLKSKIAETVHLEFKQKSQEIIQEQQTLHQIAEIIIAEMKTFYLLLRPQLIQEDTQASNSNRITGRFIKLSTQIATYQTSYLTNKKAIELKPLINQLIKRYIHLPDDFNKQYHVELNDVSSRISRHFLKHHFALIGLLLQSSQPKSLRIILSKPSARRASLSFRSQLNPVKSDQFSMKAQLFSSLAQILVNCATPLGVDSELRLTPSLIEWQITFTATQRWRENADNKTDNETQNRITILADHESTELPEDNLILVNLTNFIYPDNLLSDEFCITAYSSLEDVLTATAIDCTILVAVEELPLESSQLLTELRDKCDQPIVVCYAYIAPEIIDSLSQLPNILLLPISITSSALSPVLEFVRNKTLLSQVPQESQEPATIVVEQLANQESQIEQKRTIKEPTSKSFHMKNPLNNELLTKLNQYLETYCADESLDVEKISYALHLSSRHLARKLKELVNLSTAEYVRQYRLNKALALLNKGYPINQVGKMTGFSSRNYFSTCFKRHFGVTPSDFRNIEE